MAALFSTRACGVVARAEHLFTLRLWPATDTGQLTCRWTHDADGRLILAWQAGPGRREAGKPRATSPAA
jgi:hypothetical protein